MCASSVLQNKIRSYKSNKVISKLALFFNQLTSIIILYIRNGAERLDII